MEGDMTDVVLEGLAFPEGPRWHEGRLWFSDMHAHVVIALDPASGKTEEIVEVRSDPSGLGWLPDGTLLVVSMTDRRVMRMDGGQLVEHADLSPWATFHCNDMVVDGRGRAYVGNFGFDLHTGAAPVPATMVRVDPDGSAQPAATELNFPNGTVITPDGRTLVVGESFAGRLTAFDIADDGSLSNRRVWADGVGPDGICVDAEGAIWTGVGGFGANLVGRVLEGGEVLERVQLDMPCFACMLGGENRSTLFMLAADWRISDSPADNMARLTNGPRTGQVLTARAATPGVGWP
jgi:sugar lactone lactonase YvrE